LLASVTKQPNPDRPVGKASRDQDSPLNPIIEQPFVVIDSGSRLPQREIDKDGKDKGQREKPAHLKKAKKRHRRNHSIQFMLAP
jgi:hypothetical protein